MTTLGPLRRQFGKASVPGPLIFEKVIPLVWHVLWHEQLFYFDAVTDQDERILNQQRQNG